MSALRMAKGSSSAHEHTEQIYPIRIKAETILPDIAFNSYSSRDANRSVSFLDANEAGTSQHVAVFFTKLDGL
jgi:hypothetical protein